MGALAAISTLTRKADRINGLNPLLRPLRPGRTALRRLLLRVHRPPETGPPEVAIVGLGDGLRMMVDTLELVQRDVFLVGADPEIRALLRRHVRAGGPAIDVGAHAGLYTLLMARRAGPGLVLACEPNPGLAATLRDNVALNGLANVRVVEAAITAADGPVSFQIPADARHVAGASLGGDLHQHLRDATVVEARGARLDSLVAEQCLEGVSFVKIDAEGFEPGVLEGAQDLLRRDRPAVLFEYTGAWWARGGKSLDQAVDLLRQAGYTGFFRVSWRGLQPIGTTIPARMDVLAL